MCPYWLPLRHFLQGTTKEIGPGKRLRMYKYVLGEIIAKINLALPYEISSLSYILKNMVLSATGGFWKIQRMKRAYNSAHKSLQQEWGHPFTSRGKHDSGWFPIKVYSLMLSLFLSKEGNQRSRWLMQSYTANRSRASAWVSAMASSCGIMKRSSSTHQLSTARKQLVT